MCTTNYNLLFVIKINLANRDSDRTEIETDNRIEMLCRLMDQNRTENVFQLGFSPVRFGFFNLFDMYNYRLQSTAIKYPYDVITIHIPTVERSYGE